MSKNKFLTAQEYANSVERIMQSTILERFPDKTPEERLAIKSQFVWAFVGMQGMFPPAKMPENFSVTWRDDL